MQFWLHCAAFFWSFPHFFAHLLLYFTVILKIQSMILLQSACWAMAKSWLHIQVDFELARLQPGGMNQFKNYEDAFDRSPGQGDGVSPSTVGLENWPLQVLNQQPRHLSSLLQKLHSR